MVDFDVHGPWPLLLLGTCVVLGVPLWIGYLIGRVRTLDPHGQRRAPGEPRAAVPVAFGILLLLVGTLIVLRP